MLRIFSCNNNSVKLLQMCINCNFGTLIFVRYWCHIHANIVSGGIMAVEASSKPSRVYDFDDDDDGPAVFKRNTAASRQNLANPEVQRPSSSTANGQNSNAPKDKTTVSSSKVLPVKSHPPSQKATTSSAKASPSKSPMRSPLKSPVRSPMKSPVANSKESSPLDYRLKQSPQHNALAVVKKEEIKDGNGLKSDDDDSEDDKPLSARLKGNTNNVNQGIGASKADVAISEVNVKTDPEDSDDEVPLSSRFPKSNAGTSGAKPIDSDEKKPLASKVQQNGSTLREKQQKSSSVPAKRPLQKASSSGASSAKKPKVSDTSKEVKVKQVTVKVEKKADDDDHIPISQRMKNSASSVKKSVTNTAKATKSVSSSSKKIIKKTKKVIKNSQYSKSTKMLPGSGDGQKKWTTLVHNGVIFPPPYSPHGVKMLYKGKEVNLTPEQEEVFFSI